MCDYGQSGGGSPNPLRFDALAESIDHMVWSTRPDGSNDYFNRRWYEFTGAPEGSTSSEDWARLFHADDRLRLSRAWRRSLRSGEPFDGEYRLRHHSGEYRWVIGRARATRGKDGAILRWYGTCTDIHDLKSAQQELAQRKGQLRTILETVPVGIVMAEFPSGRIVNGNSYVERMLKHPVHFSPDGDSYDEWVSFHEDGSRVSGHEYPLARMAREGAEAPEIEVLYQRGDGTKAWTRIMGRPVRNEKDELIGGVVAMVDVDGERRAQTALRELNENLEKHVEDRTAELMQVQDALRQSQKLDAMGQITGGVAHDFNNLLTPILGGLDMLQRRGVGAGDERMQRIISGAIASAERAKTLVQRLLAFARRQPLDAGPVNLADLMADMRQILTTTLSPRIELEIDVSPSLPYVHADLNQLEVAILNLAVNARDAMPQGGKLTIAAEIACTRESDPSGLPPGYYVRLGVSDTGLGMDAETRARAVEPFFTTKGIGRGTGLGLSMAHGLVAQLGGRLTIRSELGEGTQIDILLPTANSPFIEPPATDLAIESVAPGRILLADDEETVRASIAHMLEAFGQDVIEARSAEEALALLDSGQAFDLLVTDHLMPGMSGVALARHVRTLWPEQKILIVSGYADLDDIAPDIPRLPKPFRHADLGRVLPSLLPRDEQASGRSVKGAPSQSRE